MNNNILWSVKLSKQQGYNWCWAACLEMIFNYHKPKKLIKQCKIVASKFGKNTCTTVFNKNKNWAITEFDLPLTNTQIDLTNLVANYDYTGTILNDKSLFWAAIKEEIDYKRPLIANFEFHFVVVFGYTEIANSNYYIYYNPKNDGFSIEEFENCKKIRIEELIKISSNTRKQQLKQHTINKLKTKVSKELHELVPFFDDNIPDNGTNIKLLTKVIRIANDDKEEHIDPNILPPERYDNVIDNKIMGTYELCNGRFKKTKVKLHNEKELSHVNQMIVQNPNPNGIISPIKVDNKEIILDNTKFDPDNAIIKPYDSLKNTAEFEKIIFQPFVYQFYHIRMSNNVVDDKLIPVSSYKINNIDFKQYTAYTFNEIINQLKKELKNSQRQ